ncbi:MAG: hypothetical protein IJN64_19985 [Lachnospiraceae bacterium]|nr:hypothetical protein [Lachnospiraceae bacterium]MBQ6996726.1 hypothetical protein [Lachnospiraceae bacterium]
MGCTIRVKNPVLSGDSIKLVRENASFYRISGSFLFFENDTIEKVNIPQSVIVLGYEIFLECPNQKCVVIENDEIVVDDFLADCKNVTIVSREGSTGQKYAQENNIPWKELEK